MPFSILNLVWGSGGVSISEQATWGFRDTAAGTFDGRVSEPTSKPSYMQLVPAVDQAARILFALGKNSRGSATLTEICTEVGISKSKGLGILNTLRGAGLIAKNDRSKTYGLGPQLLLLSRSLLDKSDIVQESRLYLASLTEATGCTALLGLVSGDRLFVVARREAKATLGIAVHVGNRFPLTLGAHGKAILAALPPEELEEIVAQEPLYVYGEADKDSVDIEILNTELEACRKAGYAHDLGTTQSGVGAVSAVLIDEYSDAPKVKSRIVGCLIVVGTFGAEAAAKYGPKVAAAAREISSRRGSVP